MYKKYAPSPHNIFDIAGTPMARRSCPFLQRALASTHFSAPARENNIYVRLRLALPSRHNKKARNFVPRFFCVSVDLKLRLVGLADVFSVFGFVVGTLVVVNDFFDGVALRNALWVFLILNIEAVFIKALAFRRGQGDAIVVQASGYGALLRGVAGRKALVYLIQVLTGEAPIACQSGFGRFAFRVAENGDHGRRDDRAQNGNDPHDDKQFYEGKTLFVPPKSLHRIILAQGGLIVNIVY